MSNFDKAAYDRVEELCLKDHEEHLGKIILATDLFGYNHSDCDEIHCDPPARVRVLKMKPSNMLNWTCEDFLDPNWDVELVEPHPALENSGSLWIDGISRSMRGETEHPSGWRVDENQEPSVQAVQAVAAELTDPEKIKLLKDALQFCLNSMIAHDCVENHSETGRAGLCLMDFEEARGLVMQALESFKKSG